MTSTYESIFEAAIYHYFQISLNRVNVDDCFYKILILVANYRVESEKHGVTLTKVQTSISFPHTNEWQKPHKVNKGNKAYKNIQSLKPKCKA